MCIRLLVRCVCVFVDPFVGSCVCVRLRVCLVGCLCVWFVCVCVVLCLFVRVDLLVFECVYVCV